MKLILAPSFLFLLFCLINAALLRRALPGAAYFSGTLSILIPMRNEVKNISSLIISLKNQAGIAKLEIHLLDDNSSDGSYELAEQIIDGDPRFTLQRGEPLRAGWLGKPFALQQLFHKATGDIIITLDADVILEPDALLRATLLLERVDLDFISPYPRQIACTWSERLIQPLLQWSWMSTLVVRIGEKSNRPALAVANGQFFLVKRGALEAIGGFSEIKNSVLDDMELARTLLRKGFHGTVADGSEIASCRMYNSWPQLREGFGKSLHLAFGGWLGSAIAIILLFLSSVLPLLMAMAGYRWGWVGYGVIVLSRIISALTTRGRIRDCFLHPISILLLIYLILRSWKKRRVTQWKGRTL